MDTEQWQPRELYGGAIQVLLPTRFRDVSDFRPVPDHQEVWADPAEDQSLVVEIVEHDASVPNEACAQHYWEDQVRGNQCVNNSLSSVQQLGPGVFPNIDAQALGYACLVSGVQVASKGRQAAEAANQVDVQLAVLRLPGVSSDMLFTLNSPMVIVAGSQAAEHAGAGVKQHYQLAGPLLEHILCSLRVVDWKLFG